MVQFYDRSGLLNCCRLWSTPVRVFRVNARLSDIAIKQWSERPTGWVELDWVDLGDLIVSKSI